MADTGKGRKLAARITGLAYGYLAGELRGSQIASELRAIADWIDGGARAPLPVATAADITPGAVLEVFEYWQAKLNKKGAKLTADRRTKIEARLREGYTIADIRRAIDNIAASDFHRGANERSTEYCDLTLICRTGSKLEGFRDMGGGAPAPVSQIHRLSELQEKELAELDIESAEALKRGDTHAYNQAEKRARSIRAATARDRGGAAGSGEKDRGPPKRLAAS